MTKSVVPQFLLFILFAYMVLSPLYVFESGLPQPADLLMMFGVVLGCAISLVHYRFKLNKTSLSLLLFVALVIVINAYHYIFTPDSRFLLSSLTYLYNAGVFALILILFQSAPQQTKKVLRYGFVVSLLFQVFYLVFAGDIGVRNIGTFNNPNQLGYWALLIASSLYILRENKRFGWADYGCLILAGFVGSMSLSKAFLLVFPVIILVYFFSNKTAPKTRLLLIGICVLAVAFSALHPSKPFNKAYEYVSNPVIDRLNTLGKEKDDSLQGRGYLRVPENLEYVILGAGEGGFDRFAPDYKYMELHSSLATILFSYGLIGLAYFSLFLLSVLWRAPLSFWVLMLTILSHGLVHQNIRFTGFWVFLAILYMMKKNYLKTR